MTSEDVTQALCAALTTAGATRVRVGQSDAVAGAAPYATVQDVSDDGVGFPQIDGANVDDRRSARFVLTAYGVGSNAWLIKLRTLLFVPSSTLGAAFRAAGCSPSRCLPVQDLTRFYRSGMMPSWAMEVEVFYVATVAFADADEDAVQIDVDIDDGAILVEVPEP